MRWRKISSLSQLVFDIENMPGTYGPGDWTHPKVTALGCQFLHRKRGRAWCFNRRDPNSMREQAEEFRVLWDQADVVIGHNIRRHDIKILGGLYTALGLPLLAEKRTLDTYLDQPKIQGLSRSLENLAARWGCPMRKLHLSEYEWEQAYDGIPAAVALMKKRVLSDVKINAWLYRELLERGLLR